MCGMLGGRPWRRKRERSVWEIRRAEDARKKRFVVAGNKAPIEVVLVLRARGRG